MWGAAVERSHIKLKVPGSNPGWSGQIPANETIQIETTVQACLSATLDANIQCAHSLYGTAVERSPTKLNVQGSNPDQALLMRPYKQNQLSKSELIHSVTKRL